MTKLPAHAAVAVLTAAALLTAFTVQYSLTTTFPIGGDAASHIRAAQHILGGEQTILTLRTSNYPLSHLIFAGFAAVPGSWPDRFVWWISLGHALTGAALAVLLWRIGSWPAAAAGLAIWALTPVGINTHFEDGTAPQLWSLIFLLLTLERITAGSAWGTLLSLGAATFAHFLTGAVLMISLAMGTVLLLPSRARLAPAQARLIKYLAGLMAALAALGIFKSLSGVKLPFIEPQSDDFFLLDALKSKFAPWLVLSLAGLTMITRQLRRRLPAATAILSFFWLSFLLTTNSSWHISLWENRFRTYFITSVALAAGLALPALARSAFPRPVLRSAFITTLFATVSLMTWHDNAATYRYYEQPNNQTLPPDARAALAWVNGNVSREDSLASTTATRYGEWIPVLTPHAWQELSANHVLLTAEGSELYAAAQAQPFTHLIFFTHHEDVPSAMLVQPELYRAVFTNPSVVIIKLP